MKVSLQTCVLNIGKNVNKSGMLLQDHVTCVLSVNVCLSHRPMYGRGAVSVGRAFDARQKIGTSDVRQRLGVGGATAGECLERCF